MERLQLRQLAVLIIIVSMAVLPVSAQSVATEASAGRLAPENANIDYRAFIKLVTELEPVRESRRIPLDKFVEMAGQPGTIVLDTRSQRAYELVHLENAVHINFSDFSTEKLREKIPDKATRILIYCNNNFDHTAFTQTKANVLDPVASAADDEEEIISGTTLKLPPLALNIPTFVNLWGYGYENIYELAESVPLNDSRLRLAGTAIRRANPK